MSCHTFITSLLGVGFFHFDTILTMMVLTVYQNFGENCKTAKHLMGSIKVKVCVLHIDML